MPLIADTSPLVAFSAVQRLDVLRAVCGEIWIPPAVFDELVLNGGGWTAAMGAQTAVREGNWILRRELLRPRTFVPPPRLGAGEVEAIALALEAQCPVLMDDRLARRCAETQGLVVVGSLGVLAKSKQRGLVAKAEPIVAAMQAAGIRFSDTLVDRFLREIGER